jgi:O26-antigen biosynthesis N-acetyl-L-fucosamine transferase
MRILYLVDSYYPDIRSPSRLSHDLTVELAAQGHEVTLLTPAPHIDAAVAEERAEGVRVVRVRTGAIKGASRLARGINETRLSATTWRQAKHLLSEQRHDLIVSYSPTIFFGALVARLKRLWRCPSYLILRDLFPQWTAHTGILSERSLIYRYFARKAEQHYAAADVIGVQSLGDLGFFRGRPHRVEVLYNWFRPEPAASYSGQNIGHWRDRLGLRHRFIFFYGGNIGVAQNLDLLLRLAEDLRDRPRAFVLMVGDGSESDRLGAEIRRRGLDNVALRPSVTEREYFALLREIDVGVLSLDPRLRNSNLPAKMLGYMASGKPILAALNAGHELFDLLGRTGAGLCALGTDHPTLLAHARRLLDDGESAGRMGRAARALLSDRFSADAAARQIVRHWSPAAA